MKNIIKKLLKLFLLVLLVILAVNILEPLFHKEPDAAYENEILQTEYESDTACSEQILCIDDNEEALRWRLRMIGNAQETITLATFDLRPDDSGLDMMAALSHAAERGIQVRVLVDGIYEIPFLKGSEEFHALAAQENVEIRIYNPVSMWNIFRLNYRMHDKYLIIDDRMYLLGGRNTNDIFLGDHMTGINVDRDILVYGTAKEMGESLAELQVYFEQIWNEPCVSVVEGKKSEDAYVNQYDAFRARYAGLEEKYPDMETYNSWKKDTYEADKITLISNGTEAGRKAPKVLQVIEYLAEQGEDVVIQTPYVISNRYIYEVLEHIADHADLKILLNAVEKGSNPWGCTDYLNHKKDILATGAEVYELMNEHAVHTKTVLIDDHLSIVGSYNLDMRSTYLDTELMLVIDCEELNGHIREMADTYMEKSKKVLPDGEETVGSLYHTKQMTAKKEIFYGVLRVIVRPFRHLL